MRNIPPCWDGAERTGWNLRTFREHCGGLAAVTYKHAFFIVSGQTPAVQLSGLLNDSVAVEEQSKDLPTVLLDCTVHTVLHNPVRIHNVHNSSPYFTSSI